MSRIVLLFTGLLTAAALHAQTIFPGLSGDELIDSVAAHYRPVVIFDYANARDTLYSKVLALDDDSIRCIYSGYVLYLAPGQDPTQYIYLNGSSLGMNTEHAYPQSKGAATGNARSDMHHLFPARIPVNEARGDVPYTDIPDNLTQQWFRGTQILSSQPAQNKDQYSEFRVGSFEPREAVKGDLARAVFYFYTMYRAQANAADPNFFNIQRSTLCQWAALDPPDSAELVKTWRIAAYQEGKPNPYVIDCTLAHRCWCPETPAGCLVPTLEPRSPVLAPSLSPNPASGLAQLSVELPFSGRLDVCLSDMQGKQLARWQVADAESGVFSMPLEWTARLAGQAAVLEVRLSGSRGTLRQAIPVVLW